MADKKSVRHAARRARKTALNKDLWRSIKHSKGRFLSILLLMALGSFALVGLFVAGPDMRAAASAYFGEYDVADVTVVSDYGLDEGDVAAIEGASGVRQVEFGYFSDVTVAGTTESLRVTSAPEELSQFELVEGRMPEASDEMAVDTVLAGEYPLGSTITIEEKANSVSGDTLLAGTTYTVVGYVNSTEILSMVNMGQSTAGTGSLAGYAVVTADAFDSDVYTTARLAYEDTWGLDPYSDEYRDAVQAHKDELDDLLDDRPEARLAAVRADAQEEIDNGQAEVDDARAQLDDAAAQLDDAAAQIADAEAQIAGARSQLSATVTSGQAELDARWAELEEAAAQLTGARAQLDDAAAQIASGQAQLEDGQAQFADGQARLASAEAQLADARAQLDALQASYDESAAQLEQGKAAYDASWATVSAQWEAQRGTWAELDAERSQLESAREQLRAAVEANPDDTEAAERLGEVEALLATLEDLDELRGSYEQLAAFGASYEDNAAALGGAKAELDAGWADYESGAAELSERRAELDAARSTLSARQAELAAAREDYDAGVASYNQGVAAYNAGLDAWRAGSAELATGQAEGEAQIADAEAQLEDRRAEYLDALATYEEERPDAEAQIAEAQDELADARAQLDALSTPVYDVSSRREVLGAEGYTVYATVADIIDSLARVFPVLLYLVAALVTLSTMTRMVDEERINSGTYKALGYSDADIAKKFVVYGALAGGVGSILGIVAGHTLLPMIVYAAYGDSFTLPVIHLGLYPVISAAAFALALLCSVVPAALAVRRELSERPAQLLLPKPPAGGSKIFLERVTPLWNRLSFTHKVTARNLFRYKQRMFMTILGVSGAVCMLVAGFGVQNSIANMGERQFNEILRYDLIVANAPGATADELAEADELLGSDAVSQSMPVHYESVSRVAGANGDRQEITMIVPEDAAGLGDYLELTDRTSGEPIELGESGAVVSERLATLLGVGVGDTLTFDDAEGVERTVEISGVTEMYMGHFLVMSRSAYEEVFGEGYAPNANLVTLADGSRSSVEGQAAAFMRLDGVQGVVQNTAMEEQVDTVVSSLDMIMKVLIAVSTMLAVVIMYNLTNLNVSERMRELSTIKVLGFHTDETTMYIYRETIILTVLGLVAGWLLGMALHQYILFVVPPENVMFDPAFSAIEFAVPAVEVAAITLVLYFAVLVRLRRVDMLEALKSVE